MNHAQRRLVWLVAGVLLVAWVMVGVATFGAYDFRQSAPESSSHLIRIYSPVILGNVMVLFGLVLAWRIYTLGLDELRRQVELERRHQEDLARKHQLQRILDATPDIIALIDGRGVIRAINPAGTLIMGYGPDELLGRRAIRFLHPDDRQAARRLFTAGQDGGVQCFEARCLRKGATYVWIEWHTVLLPEQGELYCVGRDISERKAHEEQRARYARWQREFVATVSHELRTPLTAIAGALGLLRARASGSLDAQSAQLLAIAARNAERLARLIDEILDLERLEAGRIELRPAVCAAGDLIRESILGVQPLLDRSGIRMAVHADDVPVLADRDRAIQVLTNLLSNAIKFSPRGAAIAVQARETATGVLFSVQDQGRGIPPQDLDRIFQPFQQIDPADARQHGGAGLGLAIVRALVEQMGGHVWVESQVGQGSRFSFTLPAGARPEHPPE